MIPSRLPLVFFSLVLTAPTTLLASYTALNLGSVAVGSSGTGSINIPLASAPSNVSVSLHYGTDFSIGSCVANGSACSVAVTFSPTHAGLRQDAVIVKDSGGNVLSEGFLYGTGQAPQVTFNPGVLQILYTGENHFQPGDGFTSLASDPAGNLYLAKGNFNIILKFPAGSSTPVIIAGQRLVSGTSGNGGPATSALLAYPTSLTVDGAGNVYFVDGDPGYGQVIRRIDGTTGIISAVPITYNYSISSLAVNLRGDLYVATEALFGYPEIKKIDGVTYAATTIAGGTSYTTAGDGGPASSASFSEINGLAVDSAGNLFVADSQYIRRIDTTTQIITSIAGNGTFGTITSGTPAITAPISPNALAIDSLNNLYFAASGYVDEIYKIDPSTGIVTAFGGGQQTNYLGIANGDLSNVANFFWPSFGNSIAFDASGNYYVSTTPIGGALSELVEVNTTSPSYSFLTAGTYFGNPSPLPITVNNIGNQSLTLSSQSVTGSFSASPSGAPACNFPGSIAADSGCSFTLSEISGSGYTNGQVILTDNSLNQSSTSQQATMTFVYPTVTASPSAVAFALDQVGTATGLNVTLTNTSRVPYTFDHAVIQGPNASDFSLGTGCFGVQNPVLQGGYCSLNITFTPSAAGARTATLLVYGNTQNPLSIPLSGTAAVGSLSLSATSVTLMQTQWQTSNSQTVTVTNTGVLPVLFNQNYQDRISGGFFVSDSCSFTYGFYRYGYGGLPPGQSCQITFYFYAPSQAGQYSGVYSLSTGLPGTQPSIALHGIAGVTGPALTFGQAPLYFTSVAGEVSSSVPLEIKNSGMAAASITSITLTGPQASDFRQFNNCPASLAAGQGCVVWVSYAPNAASPSTSTAAVTVASTGSLPQSESVNGNIVQNAVARVMIEAPAAGTAPVSGKINVSGWAGLDAEYTGNVTLTLDHIFVANLNLSLPRADVCQAYPQMGSCPNPGWYYQLDTTTIPDGVHTLTVAAGQGSDSDNSASVQFTVQNGSNSLVPNLAIDSPTASQNLSGTVIVSGWALSKQGSSTYVSLSIDGHSYTPGSNARPDVCTAYNFPSSQCGAVGWYASVNASSLPVGNHTLTVTATSNSYVVFPYTSATAVKTVNFTTQATSSPIRMNIEEPSINQNVYHSFAVSGWAVSSAAPISYLMASIDGARSGYISYGLSRSDVCAAYPGSLGCPDVGWNGTVDLDQVSNGAHTLTITAYANDGTYSTATRQINVANIVSAANDQLLLTVEAPLSNSTVSGIVSVSGWVVDGLTSYPELDLSVDGIPVAVTSPEFARTDVCAAYPWAQGCTDSYVGWLSHIDTTLLTDGTHTLTVTTTSADGKRATKSVQFVASNSSERQTNGQMLNIESPSSGAASSGALSISGWAISQASPVTEVDILIDGVPMGAAQYGLARQDVCKAYPNSLSCPNVGWYYLLDTRTLADGAHTIEAVEITAKGNAAMTQKFVVSNAGASSPIHAVIDSPAPNAALSGTTPISGWAVDDSDSIVSVAITVDDFPQGFAAYGGLRSDVCTVYPGRAGCPNVGWFSTLDTTQFQNGSHTLAVTVQSTHGDALTLTRVIQTAN